MKGCRGSVAWGGGGRSGSPSLGGGLVAVGTGEECEATSAGPPSQWIWLRGRWGLGVVREELPDGLGSLQLPSGIQLAIE